MPRLNNNIFNKKKITHLISKFDFNTFENAPKKKEVLNEWLNFVDSNSFLTTKETALQSSFLNQIFGTVLGYSTQIQNPAKWNLVHEQVTNIDGKFADGALGFFSDDNTNIKVVIELKDPKTNLDERQTRYNDNRTPIEQAFSYQHKIGKDCKWIIVSNFNEVRLYRSTSSTEYEVFYINELNESDKLKKFFFLLCKEHLIAEKGNSIIDILYDENEQAEQDISKEFYSVFKTVRVNLFEHLKANNPNLDVLLLLEKTQKLLDRFIFVCFCEDNHLLPDNIFKQIVNAAEKSFSFSETKIWEQVRGLFHAINIGSTPHNINKFNGGLFAFDDVLDNLVIKDAILKEMVKITEYDFASDIDVNILGHIFEQSINDIEELKAQIDGGTFDKKASKRKKDGIYYTPEYITKYIVENAVGAWLEERKLELGFNDLPELTEQDLLSIQKSKSKTGNINIQQHLDFWNAYKEVLMNIKVLDPACGSGAFLNQAFNYLYTEGQNVNENIAKYSGGQRELFGLDKHILSNNLYGVDLNTESVEITKLSLWLKTANKFSELTALDENIKCGNSLIDVPEVAGEKAFKWEEEFKAIFERGGFDVVIGNPPYGAELSINEKKYLKKLYPHEKSNNSAAYFIHIALNIIIENGYLSYIVPKQLTYTTAWKHTRKLFIEMQILKIIDVSEAFDDVELEQIIFTLNKNGKNNPNFISGFSENATFYEFVSSIKNLSEQRFQLWKNDLNFSIFEKFLNKSIHLYQITNYKWGGLVAKYIVSKGGTNSIKCYRGRNIQRYVINEEKVEFIDINNIDKNYYIKGEKLLFQRIFSRYGPRIEANYRNARFISTFVNNDNYVDKTVTMIYNSKYPLKFLLSVFNSKYYSWFAHRYLFNRSQLTMEFMYDYAKYFPVINLDNNFNFQPFIQKADIMLEKNKELQLIKNAFTDFISERFAIEKLNTKLQNWHSLSFDEFIKELAKQKVKLSSTEQFDLRPLFIREQTKALELSTIIENTDREIDRMVYELYELTDEEIRVVEGEK